MGDDMREQQGQQWGSRRFSKLLGDLVLMVTGSTALLALFLVMASWRTGGRFWEGLLVMFNPPQPAPQVDVRSLLIRQVRSVSELTTAVFAMEAVVPTRQDMTVGGYVVGRTTLLYIAHGEVRAGVDLSGLTPADMDMQGDSVQVRLPAPRILDSKIDVNRSMVYDYDRGFMGLGPDVAPQLQMQAQQESLKKIESAACTQGLLEQANSRAQLVVTQLLMAGGYKEVSVETTPPPAESCKVVGNGTGSSNSPSPIPNSQALVPHSQFPTPNQPSH